MTVRLSCYKQLRFYKFTTDREIKATEIECQGTNTKSAPILLHSRRCRRDRRTYPVRLSAHQSVLSGRCSSFGDCLRWRNARLFLNTLLLTLGVLVLNLLIATPAAWLTSRTRLKGKPIFTVLNVLPLAIPGYVMAYALLALGGNMGIVAQLFGVSIPRLSGYWGALLALSAYTSPYLFLNLRTALLGLDPSLEESARNLGYRYPEVFWHIILPQLRPAFYASGLLISLHVLGDFGVVSLMRYETFSYALYIEYTLSFEHTYAAWLALMLLTFTGCLLYFETKLLNRVKLHRAGRGTSRRSSLIPLGPWRVPPTFTSVCSDLSL